MKNKGKYLFLITLLTSSMILSGQDYRNNYSADENYALVIGISKYKISSNNLGFAQKDAEDFSKALSDYGVFKKDNIKTLVNSNATRENIRKNIEGWLRSNAKKNDKVVIFFSGHGAQIPDTDGDENDGLDECLVPYDFDSEDYSSLISDDIFAYWIRNLQSENVLIIFDNCFSGGAAKEKGVHLVGVKGNLGKDDFMKDISRELPKKGTALLAASKADQVSFESNEFNNGVFTHFLLASISESSDNNLNKSISARELFYATREKTLEYSKNKFHREQEPIFLDLLTNDMDLFYLPIEKVLSIKRDNQTIEKLEYQVSQTKDFGKQLVIYEQLHKLDPSDISYIFNIAWLNKSLGNIDKSIDYYKLILSSKEKGFGFSPPITSILSEIYQEQGNINLAISYLQQSSKENPNNTTHLNDLANLYLLNKDTANAVINLTKSLSIQPLQKEPYITSFFIFINKGDINTASKLISDGYSINPNDFGTQYCYYLALKYISKVEVEDSVFASIELNSGIKKRMSDLLDNNSNGIYILNNRQLNKQEKQLQLIEDAIKDYPYFDDFYKICIKYVSDNKIDINTTNYINDYLYYSKLNIDNHFIENYITGIE